MNDRPPQIATAEYDPAIRRAAFASVTVATTLIGAKLFAALMTGSMAMLGSLVDSALDLLVSLVTLFAVGTATTPADSDHRFGHGKAEGLAALFQAAVITGSAVFLALEAARRLFEPSQVREPLIGVAVSVFAIVLTVALILYQRHVVQRTGSIAIEGDSLHYTGDLAINLGVIVALIANGIFGIFWIDPVFALVIAGILAWGAAKLARRAIDMLMDKEWPDDERQKIIGIILRNPAVLEVHELRTRTSGTDAFIQFHISVAPEMSVADAHTVSDEVEAAVGEAYPNAEIFIHTDPVGLVEHGQQKGY